MNTMTDDISTDRRSIRRLLVPICALTVVLAHAAPSRGTDITACGTTVAAGDTGVLQADIVCQDEYFGVRLLTGSTLQLNGHSITGTRSTFATVLGVARVDDAEPEEGGRGRFTIVGPGEIAGAGPDTHSGATTRACVTLQDGRATITSPTGVIDIHGCNFGIVGYILEYNNNRARATIDHVILHDNSLEGITVRKLTASDVTAFNNGEAGVHAIATMMVANVIAHDNGNQGVFAGSTVKGTGVTVTGNASGIECDNRVTLTNVSATDNTYSYGVRGRRVTLTDATVTGNSQVDIVALSPPRLVNTTCGTSLNNKTQTTWGVCAND
jgi:hypothetical protein